MPPPRFAAIVRTTGERPQIREALESLLFQRHPTRAVIVVHGSEEARCRAEDFCREFSGADTVTLSAPEPGRKLGYPANVGLRYCAHTAPGEIDFVFFLDDDDIVYPFFTHHLYETFAATGADAVYGAANCRSEERPPELAYPPRSIFHLFRQNCIPINSLGLRLDTWRANPVYFDEQFEYLDDWKFLLELLRHGYRFEATGAAISEFRTTPRKERERVRQAPEWMRYEREIREDIARSMFSIPGAQLAGAVSEAGSRLPNLAEEAAEAARKRILELERRVTGLEHSWSWRISAPLRAAAGLLLKVLPRR